MMKYCHSLIVLHQPEMVSEVGCPKNFQSCDFTQVAAVGNLFEVYVICPNSGLHVICSAIKSFRFPSTHSICLNPEYA